jgi:hypothetical protein
MAEVFDIYGKRVKGKSGTVSFYMSRGKTIMRSLPGYKNNHRSQNQLRNQQRFQQMRKFCSQFKAVVIPQIWNLVATTSSGYHLFMKTNSPAFDLDGVLTDPMKIHLSMGKLNLPEGMQAQRTDLEGTTIRVSWQKETPWGGQPLKDKLMVISAGEGNYSDMMNTGLKRGDLGGSFELPELEASASHLYLFFESLDQRYYSESIGIEI